MHCYENKIRGNNEATIIDHQIQAPGLTCHGYTCSQQELKHTYTTLLAQPSHDLTGSSYCQTLAEHTRLLHTPAATFLQLTSCKLLTTESS